MKVLLGNIDYQHHMTDEGNQLQRGLEYAGWHISGKGFDDLQDCREIVDRYKPDTVIVHDKRDWDPRNYWAFRRDIGFENLEAIREVPRRMGVVKDAGSMVEYHRYFCEDDIDCQEVITYYHDKAVLPHNPWMENKVRHRTYHSVNADVIRSECRWQDSHKGRAVLTGAANREVYPLRSEATQHSAFLGLLPMPHPGYHNSGTRSNIYLQTLHAFKVHLATASAYNFALRKIIESVAVGCTPITNLPAWDCLPEIDGALVRIPSDITMGDLKDVIAHSVATWNRDERMFYAGRCVNFYDYRAIGLRLDVMITQGVPCKS